jgi:acyl-CoA synthetase (NDP forming)
MSNAGYETVGMADNHRGARHSLVPATLAPETVARIRGVLEQARIASLINVANPLDITPMANDGVHLGCMEALLDDPGVDVAVFGDVPLTPNVQTLPRGLSDRDVFDAPHGYGARTVELFRRSAKPFVVVIDAGRHYDDLVTLLENGGVPVFRSADRATTILGRYVERRLFKG